MEFRQKFIRVSYPSLPIIHVHLDILHSPAFAFLAAACVLFLALCLSLFTLLSVLLSYLNFFSLFFLLGRLNPNGLSFVHTLFFPSPLSFPDSAAAVAVLVTAAATSAAGSSSSDSEESELCASKPSFVISTDSTVTVA